MCRDKDHGGRRCPRDDVKVAMDRIMQLVNRHSRKLIEADARGDYEAVERHAQCIDDASAREDVIVKAKERRMRGETAAAQFTVESTRDASYFELRQAKRDNAADPEAVEAIQNVIEWREQQDGDWQQAIDDELDHQKAWGTSPSWVVSKHPADNPSRSTRRRLSADEECREAYDTYTHAQFLQAEYECTGNLLNKKGHAKDVDPMTLFSGDYRRASAYASEELRTWFRNNGRMTYAAWRHAYFDRDSDYAAAARNRTHGGFDNAA